ncbi:MAG: TRAP transporter large permease subunit [Syntrophaceae bacterium]|nr:TRAP transporter large permease subunit [Syntrophaceae bacterium]
MDWLSLFIIILSSLIFLFFLGVPVAYSFLFINIFFAYLFWGEIGLTQLILSIFRSISSFSLLPVPLFLLMGEIMFLFGIAQNMMETLEKWMGRLPGRLSLLAVVGGVLFATLSGSSMAGCAMLGQTLLPEMEKKGYKPQITLGPIMGCGTLAAMIPPSALGVLLACLAQISVGDFLLSIIFPGLLMAALFAFYIILRCYLQPEVAPRDEISRVSLREKIILSVKFILPLGLVIFAVIGLIIFGVATPTESAAVGALVCFVLAFLYKGFRGEVLKKAIVNSVKITVMMFMILSGASAFSQLLAYTGASQNLVQLAVGLPFPPIVILIIMQFILVLLGTFMEPLSILMVALPIYMPIIRQLGINPLPFCSVLLINMEMATISPPDGLVLYTMKAVAPHYSMGEIYKASLPFVFIDIIAMAVIMVFPDIAMFLPSIAKR